MKKYLLHFIGFSFIISCEMPDTIDPMPEDSILELAYDNSYHYPVGLHDMIYLYDKDIPLPLKIRPFCSMNGEGLLGFH